jgi:hypothetical protein
MPITDQYRKKPISIGDCNVTDVVSPGHDAGQRLQEPRPFSQTDLDPGDDEIERRDCSAVSAPPRSARPQHDPNLVHFSSKAGTDSGAILAQLVFSLLKSYTTGVPATSKRRIWEIRVN